MQDGSNLPSSQVLQLTGIKNAKTLTRWHQAGIIPAPIVGTHPDGRGKIAYYPLWVIERIVHIRHFLAEGHGLLAAAHLADRASFEAAVEQTVTIDGHEVKARDVFIGRVIAAAKPIIGAEGVPGFREKLTTVQPDIYRQALEKVHNGENGVLVVSAGGDCAVAPDYALSAGLSMVKHRSVARDALLIVPLAHVLEGEGFSVGWRRPFDFTIAPVNRVIFRSRGREFERDIENENVPDSYWRGFTMRIPVKVPAKQPVTRKQGRGRKRK